MNWTLFFLQITCSANPALQELSAEMTLESHRNNCVFNYTVKYDNASLLSLYRQNNR